MLIKILIVGIFFSALTCAKSDDAKSQSNGGTTSTTTTPPTEAVAPVVGTAISLSVRGSVRIDVQWGAATDNVTATANLEYKLVKDNAATTNIDTITKADAKAGADLVQDWTAAFTNRNVTGLTHGNTYHFAVLVRDAAGNKALYTPNSATTNAVCGNGAVEAGEGCDDGNLFGGDGCSATCTP